jgi:hypothetical protein
MRADCLRSIGKAKKLSLAASHPYLLRAIKLAKEQQIPVDKFFFQDGKYTEVRPEKARTGGIPWFKREDRSALEAHKQTPEYMEAKRALE